jgi:hypothetical protein
LPLNRRPAGFRAPEGWPFLHVRSSHIPCDRTRPCCHGSRRQGSRPPGALVRTLA